nr:PREDICTED: rap guanine nucleotide exchange factor-like 1 [Latimeria chalumnae]|eukprot:XP_014342724.1 PREDICTED: rap guanine nucleotide exchange factor-like 1 [Latimeria chalumnae]
MKPLEKFLKKQTSTLTRGGGYADKSRQVSGGVKQQSSVSKILPSFRKESTSEDESSKEDRSPEIDYPDGRWSDLPGDLKSPSLSPEEQYPDVFPETCWSPPPPGTPESILSYLLDSLTRSTVHRTNKELLLDDFILTHSVFLPTDKFLQALLQQYPFLSPPLEKHNSKFTSARQGLQHLRRRGWAEASELHWAARKDLTVYPDMTDSVRNLQQLLEKITTTEVTKGNNPLRRHIKPLFRHFSRVDSCLRPREAFRGSDEIFCRVYAIDRSYITIRSRLSASVQEIILAISDKLQYFGEHNHFEEKLTLVAVASSGEKVVFKKNDDCVFTTLGVNTHLFACTKESIDMLVPLPQEIQFPTGNREIHRITSEELANHLTAFGWELFKCVHELEFIDYVFRGNCRKRATANLEIVLQRCSEVQLWVATEILLCDSLTKRVELLKKFIHVAAICKQNQDLLSFISVVMGLDNSAVSRLRHTWEVGNALFPKDPCRNHKTYRDILSRMKPPVIPFVPLILKDMTFIHESCKTFQRENVNFEKMHMVADTVRTVRRYRSSLHSSETDSSATQRHIKAYVRQLQVIDNQNVLFELSYKLEPKDQ